MNEPEGSSHFIVLPGGGYATHAENEAEPIVDWLRNLGISSGVLRYPLQQRHPAPLNAVRSEVRRLRSAGVHTVGVMGFSAGGHLAGHAALSADSADTRVDLAVLGYAITSMEFDAYEPASVILIGRSPTLEQKRETSLDALVTAAAPPFFIWHTAPDPYVSVSHSYRLAASLARAKVPHALHVFSQGPHSLGLASGAGEADAWTELAAAWLKQRLTERGR
jgi:acetyl esterase/lipase